MNNIITIITLLVLIISSSSSSNEIQFDLETLTLSSLTLLGEAHLNNGTIRLNRDLSVPNSGSGLAHYSAPLRLPSSFSTFFSFSVSSPNPASIGAGLAFFLSLPGTELDRGPLLGSPGPSLGLPTDSKFVAVEFDTLMDVEFGDVNGNHVGVDMGSLVSVRVFDLDEAGVDLKSGNLVNAWVEYSGSRLDVSVSYSNQKPGEPVLSVPLDLAEFTTEFVYVGFSGSTQGSTEVFIVGYTGRR